MIIGFDAKRANANRTGLGNYSRFILKGLALLCPQWQLNLYLPRKKDNIEFEALLQVGRFKIELSSGLYKYFSSLWRTGYPICRRLKKDGVSIYHGLSNELPWGLKKSGIKSVVTIHDLIFLRYPQFYPIIDRFIYRIKSEHACRKADRIIAISECTKKDIVHYFNISPEKIEVIYQGCENRFGGNPSLVQLQEFEQKYSLPDLYLLFVGSIEERKNLLLAVKALGILPIDIHLVAVGKKTKYTCEVQDYAQKHQLSDRLHFFHGVSNQDLHILYKKASIFVYPSLYEGFGIPIIEAIMAGLPIIAAKGSCLEEAGGKDSIYVDPTDFKALAQAVMQLLDNPDEKERRIAASKKYVQKFNNADVFSQLEQLYNSLL